MKIKLRKLASLGRRLDRLKIRVDSGKLGTLYRVIDACERYEEFGGMYEHPCKLCEEGRDGDCMLVALSNLPGGINDFLRAAAIVEISSLLQENPEEDRAAPDQEFCGGEYAEAVYYALFNYYLPYWHYHPLAWAKGEDRCDEYDPECPNVYDYGLFRFCFEVQRAFKAQNRKAAKAAA